ncbi:MAG: carbohydrate kinase family protein [Patescibacteria group bacterium]|nr:carbohydrate kinase family protein [Patescibacteria group bacterium]MDD5490935.1 carbohydrate kinase family protein [Patescibacteria group bacterium]
MLDIITIGSATRDVFLENVPFTIEKSKKSPTGYFASLPLGSKIEIKKMLFETGGGGTNTAVTFSRLGLNTATVAAVGDDPGGKEIVARLKKEGINTNFITINKGSLTGYSVILLTPKGQRTILVHRGASGLMNDEIIPWKKLRAKWLYISSLGGNVELLKKLVNYARRNEIKIAVNPGALELKAGFRKLRPILNKAEILLLNREEAAGLSGQRLENLPAILNFFKAKFEPITIITDGARDAFVIDSPHTYRTRPLDVKIVNTTGAGDAFGSAFTAGIILKNDIGYALRLAIFNSTSVITAMGAKKGLLAKRPTAAELNKVKVTIK